MALFWTKLVIMAAFCTCVLSRQTNSKLAKAINTMALDLHLEVRNNVDNIFTSPLSISTAMAMLYLGARGGTATELKNALGYNMANMEDKEVHQGYKQLMDTLKDTSDDKYQLDIANSALVHEDYPILDSYSEGLVQNYDAVLKSVDFINDGVDIMNDINDWVQEKTRGKIEDLLKEPLDPATRLMLLNAVYFKGTWTTKFDEKLTKPATFYNYGSKVTSVPMMEVETHFKYTYFSELESQVVELPYHGEDISMWVVLPKKSYGISEVSNKLSSDVLEEIAGELRNQTLLVKLPKFKLEIEYSLSRTLANMGMKTLFGAEADLSGISSRKDLYVSDVLHKAMVEVNEEGSEAAAVTGIIIKIISIPLEPELVFVVDHPFLFLIRDTRSGTILFMGEVNAL